MFVFPKVNLQEIDRLNSLSKGEEDHRARYGLTKLSDLSKDEYKDLHLSDEKITKSPYLYDKTWNKHKDRKVHNYREISDNDNVNIIMLSKRALLQEQIDW